MQNVSITATSRNESERLEYNSPTVNYEVGQEIEVGETWDLWIDGELSPSFVEYIKIESIDLEYVVEENEWYVNYQIGYYAYNTQFSTESLAQSDLDENL